MLFRPILAVLLIMASCPALQAAHFVDATVQAGVQYSQASNEVLADQPALTMSGGAAAGDYDHDGDVDLFVTRIQQPPLLFRNQGNGLFTDVAQQAGLTEYSDYPNGPCFGDVDNDGDLDLYVASFAVAGPSRHYLYVNQGNGTFVEDGQGRGVAVEGSPNVFGFSCAMGDYNRDGYLDMAVTEWNFMIQSNRLFRNRGAAQPGYFDDVTLEAGLGPSFMWGFSVAFADLDSDGWQDLAYSGDFGSSQLYWNNQDGTFTDGSVLAGVAHDQNGMGSAFADYDGDGDLDWFVTAIFNEVPIQPPTMTQFIGNRLYRNEGRRLFSDQTDSAGVRHGYWGWGTVFLDYDNDRDMDLVMTNGFVIPNPFGARPFQDYNLDPMRFWQNNGNATYTLRSDEVGVNNRGSGKGLLTFDYDNDGDLDIFVVNNGPSGGLLYRNEGGNTEGGWLKVKVQGTTSNRSGLGAKIRVFAASDARPMVREVGVAGHYLAQSEYTQHFGLGRGTSRVSRVEVFWPKTGRTQTFTNVARNSTLMVVED